VERGQPRGRPGAPALSGRPKDSLPEHLVETRLHGVVEIAEKLGFRSVEVARIAADMGLNVPAVVAKFARHYADFVLARHGAPKHDEDEG